VHVPGRSWMTVSAARISAATAEGPTIAVGIEPTTPVERSSLYSRVAGLTHREADVLDAVVAGHDSRHAARALAISQHTLQDHLKSIFAKTSTGSRRQLVARATGAAT
jgi:DNA-binding CsgD family transcriptional regulator